MSALLWWCDFTYTICRVTLPTERVSWNRGLLLYIVYLNPRHAPHGACELKCRLNNIVFVFAVTLPTERVSWNLASCLVFGYRGSHAPHGACELKSLRQSDAPTLLFVTLPTERVSWNIFCTKKAPRKVRHAPHGACELKYETGRRIPPTHSHAPHGACELKWLRWWNWNCW